MILQIASGMITMMLAKFMLNDLPHAVGISSNPSSTSGSGMTSDIISRAGLKEYEYQRFPPPLEAKPGRVYPYTRTRTIGSYIIQMTRTDGTCKVKLYEFLEGWKKKLRAIWTGMEKTECDRKFEEVVETVIQVRYEYKTALMR